MDTAKLLVREDVEDAGPLFVVEVFTCVLKVVTAVVQFATSFNQQVQEATMVRVASPCSTMLLNQTTVLNLDHQDMAATSMFVAELDGSAITAVITALSSGISPILHILDTLEVAKS